MNLNTGSEGTMVGVMVESNRKANKTVLTAFSVVCLVVAGLLAFWVLLHEYASTSAAPPDPRTQAPTVVVQPRATEAVELQAPALNAITLPTLEEQQVEAEAARKAEIAAAMEKTRIEKEAALKKQRQQQRRQQEAKVKPLSESPEPSLQEDKAKDPTTPQPPLTCSEPDRVASVPNDERYNTLIGNKIPALKNSEAGACTVQAVPR